MLLTINDVANVINNAPVQGFESETPEKKAAEYAVEALNENLEDITEEGIVVHLDCLIKAGAEFDYIAAINLAKTLEA